MEKIIDWFKPKSPCCNAYMKNTNLHITRLYTEINIYECQSCKKEWV